VLDGPRVRERRAAGRHLRPALAERCLVASYRRRYFGATNPAAIARL
jgi:hypothetical protein